MNEKNESAVARLSHGEDTAPCRPVEVAAVEAALGRPHPESQPVLCEACIEPMTPFSSCDTARIGFAPLSDPYWSWKRIPTAA